MFAIPRLERAICAYIGKSRQLFEVEQVLGDRLLVVDYDDLIRAPQTVMTRMFEFLDLQVVQSEWPNIRGGSVDAWASDLSEAEVAIINQRCRETYYECRERLTVRL